ncbi:hypothetical protein FHR81_002096 [Actinoalloteichus hoggarensis]|uniref:Uncharacterized protein n=1 Tax=Actinoalloteichus hoggarensis TaxID=1470176 RepID=A0A221W6B6_9PSEU|nr:hypothetical protein [Actinoalloteichus hoggarensis]ASO21129.1 hypothetical protein AHOG_17520 [Actinoalloteichus hoggarensis]MBB5921058.1 hypothetical protein [Actinoalloteichus hoggarensis]
MAGGYRYHCGECDHRTAWLTESQGEEQHLQHYLSRHSGILPGGWKESAPPRTGGGAGGCLGVLGGVFLILVLASTCEAGAAVPPAGGSSVSLTVEHRLDLLR